ncbi:hypothetical protein POF50_007485 [Streptomyces sp. SL13]|uniref:Glutamate/phenylalanine/leucine/valine/L-tryptophan dehydrogenase C-terminal domain-containing protein n=1 Tax=Streptantibioticus silvisoli TaxID=2705255 RepID=A0AA90H742_9ACTN|nr:hypothetical protein [Streptantibioticus silvisoli]MDI5969187.1 hypothetical protein [Streptantibioticus silvisoli]
MTGRAVPDGAIRVRRFTGPGGATLHLAVARADPARRAFPAHGALRWCAGRVGDAEARRLARRLAHESRVTHEIHRTGFRGAAIVVTGAAPDDRVLLRTVAELLNRQRGDLLAGVGAGVTAAAMRELGALTPYVLDTAAHRVDPSTATAHGVLGAVEAWAPGPVHGLRVVVHGIGKVGTVVAARLAEAGALVVTHDVRPGVRVPGCVPSDDWRHGPFDVLVPCAVGPLVDAALAHRLRCGAVVGPAEALLDDEATVSGILHHRGIDYLPAPLVGAGAALLDSVARHAPHALRAATPDELYGFARSTVRHAAADLARAAHHADTSPAALLLGRPLIPGDGIRGAEFQPLTEGRRLPVR